MAKKKTSASPPRAKPRSDIERVGEARRHKAAADYAARHPVRAKEERRLRKAQADAARAHDQRHDGTAQTHARARKGAIMRLHLSGGLTIDQWASAESIKLAAERIGAELGLRTMSLETRIDRTGRASDTFFEALGQVRREMAYTEWRAQVAARGTIWPILTMILDDQPLTAVARTYRMHHRRLRLALAEALDLWPALIDKAARSVSAADLIAAEAGLL